MGSNHNKPTNSQVSMMLMKGLLTSALPTLALLTNLQRGLFINNMSTEAKYQHLYNYHPNPSIMIYYTLALKLLLDFKCMQVIQAISS